MHLLEDRLALSVIRIFINPFTYDHNLGILSTEVFCIHKSVLSNGIICNTEC